MSRKRRKQEKAQKQPKRNKYPKGTVGKKERERGVRKSKGAGNGGNTPPASAPEAVKYVAPTSRPARRTPAEERRPAAAAREIVTPPERKLIVPASKIEVPATPVHRPRPSGTAALQIDDGELW